MDIALPMDAVKSYYVTNQDHPIVFFKEYPSKMMIGDKILILETGMKAGTQSIRGKGTVESVIPILDHRGEWPQPGCYPFIDHFVRYIKNDPAEADRIKAIKEEFKWKFSNYKTGYILDFIYSDDQLNYIRENGEPIPIELQIYKMSQTEKDAILRRAEERKKAETLMIECDCWLQKLGMYNADSTCLYKYGVVLKDIEFYTESLDLTHYVDAKGFPIKKTPKGWRYVQEN